VLSADGAGAAVGLYSLSEKAFARVPGESSQAHGWLFPVWLADGRRLLVRRPNDIAVVDAGTGAAHRLITVGGEMVGRSVGLSRDNRWITYTETATEGDIWLATIRQ
jgi:hypothetical protein